MPGVFADVIAGDARRRRIARGNGGWLPCGSGGRGRPSLDRRPPSSCALDKVLDLLGGFDLEHHVEHLLGGRLGAGGLVDGVGLELGKHVAQVVYPLLVQGLEGLENERRLRFPLLGGRLEPRGRLVNLLRIGTPSLLAEPVRLVGGIIQLAGHCLQVHADGMDVLHLLLVLEVAEGLLDVLLDALGEQLVRGGDAVGRLEDLVPWRLEDAASDEG